MAATRQANLPQHISPTRISAGDPVDMHCTRL